MRSEIGGAKLASPIRNFLCIKHKHEVGGESVGVSPHRALQGAGLYLVQRRQIPVEQYLLATNQVDHLLNSFKGHDVVRHVVLLCRKLVQ
jgi:hypothetical protein